MIMNYVSIAATQLFGLGRILLLPKRILP